MNTYESGRDVTTGATSATEVAPKFSDTLTLSQPRGGQILPTITEVRGYVPAPYAHFGIDFDSMYRDVTMENFLLRPLQWWAESAPLGWDRVKVSENLGATLVAPVAPVDTSLYYPGICMYCICELLLKGFSAFVSLRFCISIVFLQLNRCFIKVAYILPFQKSVMICEFFDRANT